MKRRPGANRRAARLPIRAPASGGGGGGGIVTDGLVLHLDAKDPASYPGSGTTWTDLATGTETFTFNADPRYDSDQGYFNFNGNNWAQNTYQPAIAPTRGAVEMWFRWKGESPISSAVVLTGTNNWYSLGHVTGSLPDESIEFNSGVAVVMDDRQGHTYYRDSSWHQMVAVVDGVANTIYVDGVPVTTTYRSGNATSTGLINLATTYIGRYVGAGYYFDGDIAIVRVYDTGNDSFSAADVAQNYAAQSARFSSWRPDSISSLTMWVDPSDDSTITYGTGTEIVEIMDKANVVDRGIFKAPSGSPNGPNIVSYGGINWMQFVHNPNAQTPQSDELHGKRSGGGVNLIRNDVFSGNTYEAHVVVQLDAMPTSTNSSPWTNNLVGPSDSSGYWGFYARNDGQQNPGAELVNYNYSSSNLNPDYHRYAVNVGDKHILGQSRGSSTNLYNYLDGTTVTNLGAVGNTLGGGSGQLRFGAAHGSGSEFTGRIGEVLIFNDELSASDRNDVVTYLKAKWGI